jgi:hypothetical protein
VVHPNQQNFVYIMEGMKGLLAVLVAAGILYSIDAICSGGRYSSALIQILRLACASVGFYW